MHHRDRNRRRRQPKATRTCPLGKVRFPDHAAAVAALHHASAVRRRAAELGTGTTRQEHRSYECAVCHGHHLTSQPLPLAV